MAPAANDTGLAALELDRELAMDVRVLGPLEARLDGRPFTPTATKVRQMLALLALQAGALVTTSAMVEELWGRLAPRSAVPTVQTYILKLRKSLKDTEFAGDPRDILVSRPGGYTLDISPDMVDANRFQRLAAAGEQALAMADYETASRVLGDALDAWRGGALLDVPKGYLLGIEVTRLEQSRQSVLESRIDADLRLGRHHRLLGELAELTARYPMHEKLCSQYMTALSVCGQKWRALETFRALRKTLVHELGIEPSLQIQRLQRAILESDIGRFEHLSAPVRR